MHEQSVKNCLMEVITCEWQLVPGLRMGRKTRLILHIGNGGDNDAAALEDRGALMLSVTPANSGVRLVEKGNHPGLQHSFSAHRLPYCSQAFDLVRCSACNVAWHRNSTYAQSMQ